MQGIRRYFAPFLALIGLLIGTLALVVPPALAGTITNDTSLQVNFLHDTCPSPGAVLQTSGGGLSLTLTPKSGDALGHSALPAGVTASSPASNGAVTFTSVSNTNANDLTLVVTEKYAAGCVAARVVTYQMTTGNLSAGGLDNPGGFSRSYVTDQVVFKVATTGTVTASSTPFAFQVPTGIVADDLGRMLVMESKATAGTYGSQGVTYTDDNGAMASATFQLVVQGTVIMLPGDYGDMVNPFGNGFDSFRQGNTAGTLVIGWTATQADPATHFLRIAEGSNFQFEYAPHGSGSGLCVSDPGGGWASDPLRDGLLLTRCNTGPFQKFTPLGNALRNVATGLVISPNGTGSQLRGTASPVSWGGSNYGWRQFSDLPL